MSKLFKAKTHPKLEDLMKEYNQLAYQVGDKYLKIHATTREIDNLKTQLDELDKRFVAAKAYWDQVPKEKTEGAQDATSH